MNKFFKWLSSGEWSYSKYKSSYRDSKFDRNRDIIEGYISQIPYIKLIGSPIAGLMIIIEWLPIVVMVFWESRKEIWENLKMSKK